VGETKEDLKVLEGDNEELKPIEALHIGFVNLCEQYKNMGDQLMFLGNVLHMVTQQLPEEDSLRVEVVQKGSPAFQELKRDKFMIKHGIGRGRKGRSL